MLTDLGEQLPVKQHRAVRLQEVSVDILSEAVRGRKLGHLQWRGVVVVIHKRHDLGGALDLGANLAAEDLLSA